MKNPKKANKHFFSLAVCLFASGCANQITNGSPDTYYRDTSITSSESDIRPCTEYASRTTYDGDPYVSIAYRKITRHEGMDFCTRTGAEVIAPASGTVMEVARKNEVEGGWVTIYSNIKTDISIGNESFKTRLYIQVLHITPISTINTGDEVKAGQLIGVTEPGGKPAAGPRPHVHLEVRTNATPNGYSHINPNPFWQKGPRVVSCFDPENPPSDSQLVAPVKCKSKSK
jgi:murein DD-endopeptidase MepM/ murein hydrolase activator NlpD